MANEKKNSESVKEEFAVLGIIGAFLGVFGLAVIGAVFFTPTFHGRVINLISGLILIICAAAAIFKSRHTKTRKQ